MKRITLRCLLALLTVLVPISDSFAQIYKGGFGDGYADQRFNGNLAGVDMQTIYKGGIGDGFAASYREGFLQGPNISVMFSGGVGDGYTDDRLLENLAGISLEGIYKGGKGDGYTQYWVKGLLEQSIIFPIELLAFDAIPIDKYVQLSWTTASELNNARFTVERSLDAVHFDAVLEVSGAGTSHQGNSYEAKDLSPFAGSSFYRLKQSDFDGAFSYSRMVEVYVAESGKRELVLFPNPNPGTHLSVRWNHGESLPPLGISIRDLQGRELFSRQFYSPGSLFQAEIPLGKLFTKGAYVLTLTCASTQESKLFFIQ